MHCVASHFYLHLDISPPEAGFTFELGWACLAVCHSLHNVLMRLNSIALCVCDKQSFEEEVWRGLRKI
jgi:hypothetical protein